MTVEPDIPDLSSSLQWPEYLVTAPHRIPVADDDLNGAPWMPFGTWHARRSGSLVTACCAAAVEWLYTWTLRFDPTSSVACRACVDALSRLKSTGGADHAATGGACRVCAEPMPSRTPDRDASGRSAPLLNLGVVGLSPERPRQPRP
jgi:hypothetical protein